MNQIVPIHNASWTPQQIALMKRTVASDCNVAEFDHFCHVAAHLRLDPLRRQIYAFVFSKDKPSKRRMAIVVGIDGFRAVADRTGSYRPDEKAPRFVHDENAKDPEKNPSGLVSAEVSVYKHSHGAWFPVTSVARWDEFAPITEIWEYSEEERKHVPSGKFALDPKKDSWHKMPTLMLAKCAEAQALRRGWPDDLSNIYEQSEMDHAHTLDLTPSEWAERANVEDRLSLIGGADAITFEFDDGMERVALGKLGDRIAAHLDGKQPFEIVQWRNLNREPLREFWARAKNDALEIKKLTDKAEAKVQAEQDGQK